MSNKCCKCGKEAKFYNEYRYADKDPDRVYYCADCAIDQSYREGKIDDGHIIKYCSKCNTQLINGCYILGSNYCCADCFVTGLGYDKENNMSERKNLEVDNSKNLSCKQENITFDSFECYRSNHFEIVFTDYENGLKDIEELRLAVTKAKLDKFSGKLTVYVYAIKPTLEYIDTLHEGQLYNVKYTLYSPDASCNFVILKRMMKLTEVSFESYSKQNDVSLIRLDLSYA